MDVKHLSTKMLATLTLAALWFPLADAGAQSPEPAEPAAATETWRLALAVGGQHWSALSDLQAGGNEAFDSGGLVVDLAVHGPATVWGGWRVGMDVGMSFTEGDIPGLYTNMDAGTLYLTPSVRIPVGNAPLTLDLGLGYYRADFGEVDCFVGWGCVDLGERWHKNTVGGYIGASWDHPLGETGSALSLTLRVHFADYGVPAVLGPAAGRLNGPASNLLVGFAF